MSDLTVFFKLVVKKINSFSDLMFCLIFSFDIVNFLLIE